jgi:large subunit ribosomal protein L5
MSDTAENTATESYVPRLKTYYADEVVGQLVQRFGYTNQHAVPQLEKIVLNIGVGEAVDDKSALSDAVETLRTVSGQEPIITKSRRAVSQFRLRENIPIGCKVTLRRERMWEFLDRLISIVLPRVRDFRGVSSNSFDGTGNYSLGIRDVGVFPELNLDELDHVFGMDVCFVTSAESDQEAMELMSQLGMPFRQQ